MSTRLQCAFRCSVASLPYDGSGHSVHVDDACWRCVQCGVRLTLSTASRRSCCVTRTAVSGRRTQRTTATAGLPLLLLRTTRPPTRCRWPRGHTSATARSPGPHRHSADFYCVENYQLTFSRLCVLTADQSERSVSFTPPCLISRRFQLFVISFRCHE